MVRLRRNFGPTAALSAGFHEAKGDIIIAMDGDLQHAPEDIPALLKPIDEGYDIASGCRHERADWRPGGGRTETLQSPRRDYPRPVSPLQMKVLPRLNAQCPPCCAFLRRSYPRKPPRFSSVIKHQPVTS